MSWSRSPPLAWASDLAEPGGSLWIARPHQASQLLCAWNAFALQTLGDQLVEADYGLLLASRG